MNTSSWKWFRYDEIFDIRKGKRLTKENMTDGDIRYIGAIDSNNGLSAYIGNDSHIHQGNTITVSYNGSIGFAFYQDKEFWATDDVNVLYPKFLLNRYIAIFLCHLIEMEQYRFCYGRKWDLDAMNKSKIKLPVTQEGTPDWKYMEDFIKDQIIPQLPKKAQKVWLKKYETKPLQDMKPKLNTQEWKWFKYTDLFTISGSKTTPLEELESYGKGEYPYVTTQAVNNGIEGYYNYWTEKGGVLTVDSAVLGFCSYQERNFSASDHVEILTPLFEMNRYVALFLTTLINKEQYRYSYGRKCSQIKLRNARIKLPVTPEGTPDWQFMEDYIKSLPYSKNLEPSKADEIVDELMEVKKRVIDMQRQLELSQQANITNYGTVNIYEK